MIQCLSFLTGLPIVLLTAALGIVMMLDSIPLIGILIPADAAVLAATAGRGPVGGAIVALGVIGGCLTSWSLSFFIGRQFGERLRTSRLGTWIGPEKWTIAERMLAAGGTKILLAAPFLPLVNTLMPLAAGGLRVSYRRFLPAVAVGSTLWSALYVTLGVLAGTLGKLLDSETTVTVATMAVGLLIGWAAVRGARRRLALTAPTADVTAAVAAAA